MNHPNLPLAEKTPEQRDTGERCSVAAGSRLRLGMHARTPAGGLFFAHVGGDRGEMYRWSPEGVLTFCAWRDQCKAGGYWRKATASVTAHVIAFLSANHTISPTEK